MAALEEWTEDHIVIAAIVVLFAAIALGYWVGYDAGHEIGRNEGYRDGWRNSARLNKSTNETQTNGVKQ